MGKELVWVLGGLPWNGGGGDSGSRGVLERFRRGVVDQWKPGAGSRDCSCRELLTGARGAVEPGTG